MRVDSVRDMAAAVRGRRQDLSLSQADLARRAGVSRQWINAFEAGKPTAEFGLVIRVLDALGLSLGLLDSHERPDTSGPGSVDLDALIDEHRQR
ncbi:MAG: type II toxin-antitoxin system Y4mF family antitoxin [Acidimicrobiales bacterium]